MPPSQDQDHGNQRPIYLVYGAHPNGDNVGCRPVLWVYGIPIALSFIGFLIAVVGRTYTWVEVGFLFMILSASAMIGIPGVLLAMRHPWGAVSPVPQQQLRHPRLGGLVEAWIGLIFFGFTVIAGANFFSALPFFATRPGVLSLYIVMTLGIGAPVLALYLFDRRR